MYLRPGSVAVQSRMNRSGTAAVANQDGYALTA